MPLGGFVSPRVPTPEEYDGLAPYNAAPTSAVVDTLLTGGTLGQLTPNLISAGTQAAADKGATLSPADANARYGIPGALSFDQPISEAAAGYKQYNKRDELFRRDILSRNQTVGPLSSFGISMAGTFLDPASAALNFVPVVGESKLAATLGFAAEGAVQTSRLAAAGRGVVGGAYAGAFGTTVAEAASYGVAQDQGRDYTLSDALTGVLAGTLLGAGAGSALGAAGWRSPAAGARGRIAEGIRSEAAAQGVDGDAAVRIAQLESGLDPNAHNPHSSAEGLFQFTDATWNAAGGGDRTDAALSSQRGVQLMAQNRAALARSLGREPEGFELYLAHQQGVGGAEALLADPSRNAVDALASLKGVDRAEAARRIRLNGGREDMSAGEFSQLWADRYGQAPGAPPAASTAAPSDGFDPLPRAVAMLDDEARLGALAKAVDDLSDGRPVEVGDLIDPELARAGEGRGLDESPDGFGLRIPGRVLDGDVAVTVRGTEIPVRYAVVEADSLITSHDADLVRNPDYPEALQPRERDRAGSQARLMRMEREFNPRRLLATADAESGAPIIAPDGVVESGNGRSIVLARNAAQGTDLYAGYRAALEERGYPVEGMKAPVLVRVREQAMSGADRVRLTREMNADTAERYSATEQAFADAASLSPEDIALYGGGEVGATANDAFARRFIDKAGAGQENDLVDPVSRRLSRTGSERVQAALLAQAYGDRDLVFQVFETSDPSIKLLGGALTDAAPDWAKMRAAASAGELAEGADVTDHLVAAVALVRHARERRLSLADLVADRRDQVELFSQTAPFAPETEWFLRLFFRDERFKLQRSADAIAEGLRTVAKAARETTPGPDLFGDAHDFDARAVLETAVKRLRGDLDPPEPGPGRPNDGGPGDGPAGPGGGQPKPGGEPGLRPGGGASEGPAAGPAGGPAEPQAGIKPPAVKPSLFDDPELKALAADVEAASASLDDLKGLTPAEIEAARADPRPPETIAEAVRAAAFCLATGEE